ncbi:MAG: hypothetical protein LUD22_03120 [Coprobacillus sp.]|nr:hypothetical protein [Coprobacillus sp.]
MKMKDKLTKTNRSPRYYRVKRFSLFFLIFASAAALIAIPTYTVISHENSQSAETQVIDEVIENS